MPIASFATLDKDILTLDALVGQPDASLMLRAHIQVESSDFMQAGEDAASALMVKGAGDILSALSHE